MTGKNPLVSPILKWVGGKRQLIEAITPLIPNYSTYYEPFLGGGAVLFNEQPKKAIINDSNIELMNVYHVIKDNPEQLIQILNNHKENHGEEYFYNVRSLDRNRAVFSKLTVEERAARTIYLNKTCYNGLFRVNNAGEFNAPWGRYKNPNITNETTIAALNIFFNKANITIKCGDYRDALKGIRKGAFVYFDPPYMPISTSSSFTGYTANGFAEREQIALKEQCDLLEKKNIKFLLSNSACPFIEELYHDYIIKKVSAKRTINANPEKRGAIQEVLIRNYELD
jgi:DNA adenine methylase